MRRSSGTSAIGLRAAVLSLLLLGVLLLTWHWATSVGDATAGANSGPAMTAQEAEYAKLMGKSVDAPAKTTGFPTLTQLGGTIIVQLAHPFTDNGPNDKGIGIQLGFSLARVALGFLLAAIVAIPLGFVLGMSPLVQRALNPFIQILKPISPLAWMPLALYTIKDSSASGVFVIFICSVWPMLMNTAFGVASVRREWLDVARTLEVSWFRRVFLVMLPAAAPTILTGMRISMSIAWLVIVAAEMLVGGTGIGYFLWNEWNNLSLSSVIFAVLMIGLVGMVLDMVFARLQKFVTYVE
jgi:nitrate/nitrite transport system permease protein